MFYVRMYFHKQSHLVRLLTVVVLSSMLPRNNINNIQERLLHFMVLPKPCKLNPLSSFTLKTINMVQLQGNRSIITKRLLSIFTTDHLRLRLMATEDVPLFRPASILIVSFHNMVDHLIWLNKLTAGRTRRLDLLPNFHRPWLP